MRKKKCMFCRMKFKPKNKNQKFCSEQCRKDYWECVKTFEKIKKILGILEKQVRKGGMRKW